MINYNETVSVLIIELCNYNNKVERELTIHVHCTPALGLSTGWLLSGVKVEIKRRWNYEIPWAPHKIFWAPYFLADPSKSLSITGFQRVIKRQKENTARRVNV